MIPCICIDDTHKPNEIPNSKWVKKGEKYHVIYTITVLPQRILAFHLSEIELTDNEYPYEYFAASRFAFTKDNLDLLNQMIKDCSESEASTIELIKQCQHAELG
jgi:hypothetical protein